jgi:dipicolinate synthase subunit B
MENKRILFGICGSFCNHAAVLEQLTALCEHNDVTAVVSENVYTCSTRFFDKDVFLGKVKDVTKHDIIHTIVEAEKVGPANAYDIMVIAQPLLQQRWHMVFTIIRLHCLQRP